MKFLAYTHANPLIQGSGGEKCLQGFLEKLAEKGWREACRLDSGLAQGLNTIEGRLTNLPVSEALGIEYVDKAEYLK